MGMTDSIEMFDAVFFILSIHISRMIFYTLNSTYQSHFALVFVLLEEWFTSPSTLTIFGVLAKIAIHFFVSLSCYQTFQPLRWMSASLLINFIPSFMLKENPIAYFACNQ